MYAKAVATILAGLCTLALAQSASAQFVTRGPYLQIGTPTSIIVRWRTSTATDSRVLYGQLQGSLTNEVFDPTTTTKHEVQLIGLSPQTTYYYAVGTSAGNLAGDDADHYFVTSPTPGSQTPARIWVIGDSGTKNANAAAVRDAYIDFNGGAYTQAWLMLGDNAYSDGTDSEYQAAVFDMYPSLLRQTVVWPTLGNHDGHTADSDTLSGPYYEIFTLPRSGEAGGLASSTEAYYSFDYGNIHFICLDSYDSDLGTSDPMLTWLKDDLAATTQNWIIAYWHHPPYSKGSHDSDSSGRLTTIRENVLPILESYGVDLVLSGHSHSYERSYQLYGHYGKSNTLDPPTMIVDGGDGREDGDGEYIKDAVGSVYIVAGSSGKTGGGSLDHPVMYASLAELGSMVIDVDGNRMDATFLRENGAVDDYFTILKGNLAPSVDAGFDLAVILPADGTLDGTVSDDGQPEPPGLTTTTWSKVDGPGTATFGDAGAVDTTVTFSAQGTYTLLLTADDGEFTSVDEVTATVYPVGTINQPPTVNAGSVPPVGLPASASLDGTVNDDGLPNPPGTVITTWSMVSGPGTVIFADASAIDTTASFSAAGSYTLRLTASDGESSGSGEVVIGVIAAPPAPNVLDIRVAASSDDAEESSSGSVKLTSSDLELTQESSTQTVGMRFNGVTIPAGATISLATLQFKVDESDSGSTSLTIQAQAEDNPPTFSSSSGDVSTRSRTTAEVSWSPPPWPSTGAAGADQRTPDIAAVIQEIVNRQGWASGNSLVIIITGTGKRVAESYNGDSNGAPLLHVEYYTGPPVNTGPAVNAGADQTVTLPGSAALSGTVSDDGLPDPLTLTTTWSMLNGPGAVIFTDVGNVDTTASFSSAGSYTLRLTADDTEFTVSDDMTVTVNPEPVNLPPNVTAGTNQTITLPASAALDGTVTDDGLPSTSALVTTWSKVSGLGTVTFADASTVDTTASFSTDDTYVLRLTAFDGEFTEMHDITITVNPQPPNTAPTVDAGSAQTIILPASANLGGTVTDDGLPDPPALTTTTWSMLSGPGTVTFADAGNVNTTASFSTDGTYVLHLVANDSVFAPFDDVTITVNPAPPVPPAPEILDVRISTGSDDAEQKSSGSLSLNSSDLELIRESSDQTVGMRFNGITIPPGATIALATIQFKVDEDTTETTTLTIQGQAADNPPTFSSSANVISRARTVASAVWSPPAWPTRGAAGGDQRTSNIAPVIQEIVNRQGWASGNSLVIIITGTGKRVAESFNGDSNGAALLHLEYYAVPPVNTPPTVNAGADQTVTLPSSATLAGSINDDGLPDPLALIITWSQVNGPGTVIFADAGAVDTTATFSTAGTYTLRLTANDGEYIRDDTVTVTINPAPPNQAPTVGIGAIQPVPLSALADLDGTVTDDGLPAPPGTVTTVWSQMSGLGAVTFTDVNAVDTTASFSLTGSYTLRLTADDSDLSSFTDVSVEVIPAADVTIEVRISSSSDDAEEKASGSMKLTSSDLELVYDKSDQIVGMRFNSVDIPSGATITDAYIQFQVDETPSGTTSLTVQAQAADDPPTFTNSSGNISSRARTTAAQSWSPPPWPTKNAAGPDQRTPNIASVIQEVVNRAGWSSGNSLVIIITGSGERVAESYNGVPSAAALLHVEYSW